MEEDKKCEVDALPGRVVTRMTMTGHAMRCGEGWFALVEELDRALAALDPGYRLFAIARTGGALVFDAEPSSPELANRFAAIVGSASEAASRNCEVCGEPGERSAICGVVEVLCAEHRAAAEAAGRRHRETPY
ncbi:hypothetical protein BJ993_002821 [Nocardioides aromaticivorans]|uniref:Uncharacterized protein n=1 Tax=Nocardioides aromaticivorans TaxID=200618 RepID=A0A7Y9ZIZ4_9ACTN|nr:hypothetical protein [Nocardioides aromaticivorans]NYI45741.1 hypothetical protein [Nocardioides aromaticivorans]